MTLHQSWSVNHLGLAILSSDFFIPQVIDEDRAVSDDGDSTSPLSDLKCPGISLLPVDDAALPVLGDALAPADEQPSEVCAG